MASTEEGAGGDLMWSRKGHPPLVLAWCLNLFCKRKRGASTSGEGGGGASFMEDRGIY